MQKKVRISQCMIVKNEEKNIRRALSWGKRIMYEQIVIDTGSNDRTVEIAREMGARVYHFEWIGDFSAAKNYAIEKAVGDWIAFLDADEYLNEEDTKKLYGLLEKLDKDPLIRKRCVIQSGLLELNDDGKVFSTTVQQRVFSNTPNLRYVNKIHEKLQYRGKDQLIGVDVRKEISVYHTGYSASAYRETKKLERNIEMLRAAILEDPEDGESWSYLGDSLYGVGKLDEAEKVFEKSLTMSSKITKERKELSYFGLVRSIGLQGSYQAEEVEERLHAVYEKAIEEGIEFPDLDYWMGEWMYAHDRKEKAAVYLEKALEGLEQYHGGSSLVMTGDLENVYTILAYCHIDQGNKQSAIRYGVLALRLDRHIDSALQAVLSLLRDEPGQGEDPSTTCRFLEKLYDFTQLRDRLFVMKAAKKTGFHSLYDMLYDQMNEEEKGWLNTKKQSPYRLEESQMKKAYPEIPYENETDIGFIALIQEVKKEAAGTLLENLKEQLADLRKKRPVDYDSFLGFYAKYSFWGALDPTRGKYEVLERRICSLQNHVEDYVWLYSRLKDRRSRRTLFSIIDNWLHLNLENISEVKENGRLYFDTDLISSGRGMVFVDVGAYIGDSILDYIKTYGEGYMQIYCYEITPDSVENLRRNTKYYPNIEIRQKAAGDTKQNRYIKENEDKAANCVVDSGEILVEQVTLDEDIKEAIDFIKLDVEGMEEAVLKGCEKHIRGEHPKLAVSIYHGYEDIWKIPKMICEWDSAYHLYLRHYGGDLIPTEFILYAV